MIYVYSSNYYQASNGIKIGFRLVQHLNEGGVPAAIVCKDPRKPDLAIPEPFARDIIYLDEGSFRLGDNDIVVYPEIVGGNPLGAKRVVRYLLNRPYYLSGEGIEYSSSDFLTAYSRIIDADLGQLFVMLDDRDFISPFRDIPKADEVCFYFGKVDLDSLADRLEVAARIAERFRAVTYMTRLHPARRSDIFGRLAKARLLVSFDPISNINYEATLLGTPVLLLDDSFDVASGIFNIPLYGFCTDPSRLPSAEAEVGLAFEEYSRHLETQESAVRTWAAEVEAHFNRFEDPLEAEYRGSREAFISRRAGIDRSRYIDHREGRPLVNVNFPAEIPDFVGDALGFGAAVRAARARDDLVRGVKAGLRKIGLFDAAKKIYRRARGG